MTQFEFETIRLQFVRIESELANLKGMVRDVVQMNAPPPPPNFPLTVEQPPTEAPEPRAPQHFDGHHWRQGPSPEPSDADKVVGKG